MSAHHSWHVPRTEEPSLVDRFRLIEGSERGDARATMAREVRAGLRMRPRSIPPKYFYDERGSRLFDAICELPEYYLTRSERALLTRDAEAIVASVGAGALIEIGSGMARKTAPIVEALGRHSESPRYVPFDIARAPIEASARALLARFPRLSVCGVVGDFAYDLPRLSVAAPPADGPRLFAFLGSTIGNLDERAAPEFIRAVASLMSPRDGFLLGVDLVKSESVLHAAYNDAQGVTAAFNKNVLRVLSRELDADFDEQAFEHRAPYDAERQRIEMHLVAERRQVVTLRALRMSVEFAPGELILTEISRKFTHASVGRLLASGGMRLRGWYTDDAGSFALCVGARA